MKFRKNDKGTICNNKNVYYYSKNGLIIILGPSWMHKDIYFYNILNNYHGTCLLQDNYTARISTAIKYGLLTLIKKIRILNK